MFFKRSVSILFMLVLLFAGGGASFLVGRHMIRNRAANQDEDFEKGNLNTETITLSTTLFNALAKEYISEQVFEIQLNGSHYDIYKTEKAGDTIKLFAVHDKAETELVKALQEKNKQHYLGGAFPFFPFVAVASLEATVNIASANLAIPSNNMYYIGQLHAEVIPPPPNKIAA